MATNPASARSRLYQLLAWGLTYPVPELVEAMRSGQYADAIAEAHLEAFSCSMSLPRFETDLAAWEAEYATLFDVGARGKPAVSLNSGDDEELLDGRSRPEFLLEFVQWYSHFGLRLRREEDVRELPDHLTCQLEFLAWLAHLESGADPNGEIGIGYRRAQLDFCERCLEPFAMHLTSAVATEVERRGLDPFMVALLGGTLDVVRFTEREVSRNASPVIRPEPSGNPSVSEGMDLWGEQP